MWPFWSMIVLVMAILVCGHFGLDPSPVLKKCYYFNTFSIVLKMTLVIFA